MRAEKELTFLTIISAIFLFGVIYSPPLAFSSNEVICDRTTLSGTINNDVIVPLGSSCQFENVSVNGNIFLEDKTFAVFFESTINGNIIGSETVVAYLTESHVNGNVFVDGCLYIVDSR